MKPVMPAAAQTLSSKAYQHVHHLSVEIGSRTIGSPGGQAAAAYITRHFLSAGLEVDFQEFTCPDWADEETLLELNGQNLEAGANTFSPCCDLSAETIPVGTLAELEQAEITGKIPVFYGELAQHEIAAKGAIYVSDRDHRIHHLLESRRPAAVITLNPVLNACWRLIEDFDFDLPSATVTARSGLALIDQAGAPVHLRIVSRRSPSFSGNVIGRLPGRTPARIVLCAHYDTKVETPGAYDNAAGVACLLALAGQLVQENWQHSLEFVAFSGEEIYGLGDMVYASRNAGQFDQTAAAINFDGVGPKVAANTLAVFAAPAGLEQQVDRIKSRYPGVAKVDPWPASDHYIFYSNGVPSVALSSVGVSGIYHTPADTIDWISPAKLGEAAALAGDLARLLDSPEP